MNAERLIREAKRAIEQDRPHEARSLLQPAAEQTPNDPRIWLLLAGIAPSPRAREAYLQQAAALRQTATNTAAVTSESTKSIASTATPTARRGRLSSPVNSGLLLLLVIAILIAGGLLWGYQTGRPLTALVAAWLPESTPVQTAVNGVAAEDSSTGDVPRAEVPETAEESLQPTPTLAAVSENTEVEPAESAVASSSPEAVAEVVDETAAEVAGVGGLTSDPSLAKQIAADSQPRPAWTPTLAPTPTPEPTATPAPEPAPGTAARPAGVGDNERWIDVNLTSQTLTAFEGDTVVLTSLISSGTWLHPTVTGQYRTYVKYESQTMNGYLLGYDYYLEGVPHVMYFYRDYAIHGAYWHNNFGTPMSHGCVNVNLTDAAWLYDWAPVGTLVNVHY